MKSSTSSRFASSLKANFLPAASSGDSARPRLFLPPLLCNVPYNFFVCPTPSSYRRRYSAFRRGDNLFLPPSRALSTAPLIPNRSAFISTAHLAGLDHVVQLPQDVRVTLRIPALLVLVIRAKAVMHTHALVPRQDVD